jgi:mannose-6-phosphate isomerase class I
MESTTAANKLPQKWSESIVTGKDNFCDFVIALILQEKCKGGKGGGRGNYPFYPSLAFDGFPGFEWSIISLLEKRLKEKDIPVEIVDGFALYKKPEYIWKLIAPLVDSDPHFGKIFRGKLEDFLDLNRIKKVKTEIKQIKEKEDKVIIWFGCGVFNRFLKEMQDYVFYLDLTREKFLKRIKESLWFVPPAFISGKGSADVGLSIQEFKLSQYICYPIFDKQRRNVLEHMDFYIDSSDELKLIPKCVFESLLSALVEYPIRLKPLYIQSPWGGKWIREVRNLSSTGCAWAFEAVAPDMSLIVNVDPVTLEIPFITLLSKERKKIMGEKAVKKFGWFFPIRVHYDDSFDGGNMAIQVHPNSSYVKKHFNEFVGQHEAYYIIKTKAGSKVYLGLKEGIDLKDFYEKAKRARDEKIPLDYENYANAVPSVPGDLFLIPAGTLHALGKDQVCLEIGTSYGYTFHVYDYLRPDLKGNLREIHLEHAFKAIKDYRKAGWVAKHLKQSPRILRNVSSGVEYLLGRLQGIPFEVRRIEFEEKMGDNTSGKFHILTLIKGNEIEIRSVRNPSISKKIYFSETVIIPASFGEYVLDGKEQCTVLKVLLKDSAD